MKARCVMIHEYSKDPKIHFQQVQIGDPADQQVLIQVEAHPINPSDILFMRGYQFRSQLPSRVGFQGCGRVVKAGKDAEYLLGKRVCFASKGSWATHVIANRSGCIRIDDDVPRVSAASGIVNPLTVIGLIDFYRKGKFSGIIHSAGASALGRMLIRFCRQEKIPLLNLVRKKEYIKLLKQEQGSEDVLVMEGDWEAQLKKESKEKNLNCCFQAIGGTAASKIFKNLTAGSTMVTYGFLSQEEDAEFSSADIFAGKKLDGFLLFNWLGTLKPQQFVQIQKNHSGLLKGVLSSKLQAQVKHSELAKTLTEYEQKATQGKLVVLPGQ